MCMMFSAYALCIYFDDPLHLHGEKSGDGGSCSLARHSLQMRSGGGVAISYQVLSSVDLLV